MLLNREMARAVLHTDLTEAWAQSSAPDESLIGTQLSLMGYPLAERALPAGTTWSHWAKSHHGHPETYGCVDEALLVQLLAAPHFFARKFSADSNIRECGLHRKGPARVPASSLMPGAHETVAVIEESGM